jgi:hypothetical protein
VWDRTNHGIHTENDGHETDHQDLEPGRGENHRTKEISEDFRTPEVGNTLWTLVSMDRHPGDRVLGMLER